MNKFTKMACALAITVSAGFTGTITAAETLDITVVAGHPPVFRWVKHIGQTFVPALEKALQESGTTVKWSQQYGGSLAKVGEELETVEEGLAEIGLVNTIFDPSKMAEQNVTFFTPFVSSDARLVGDLVNQMQFDNPSMTRAWSENGLVYLGGSTPVDDYLLFTKFPVNSIADLKGKKIGAGGPSVNWVNGTGAVGVSGNLTTYYNELKTGVYDGVIIFATAALPGKLYEVAPYITRIGFGAQYPGGLAANKDWYDGQTSSVQAALKSAADSYRKAYLEDLEASVTKSLEIMVSKGATVSEASAEFKKEWTSGMDNIALEWAAKLDASGRDGTKVLKDYMDAMRAAGATPVRNWDQE